MPGRPRVHALAQMHALGTAIEMPIGFTQCYRRHHITPSYTDGTVCHLAQLFQTNSVIATRKVWFEMDVC